MTDPNQHNPSYREEARTGSSSFGDSDYDYGADNEEQREEVIKREIDPGAQQDEQTEDEEDNRKSADGTDQ